VRRPNAFLVPYRNELWRNRGNGTIYAALHKEIAHEQAGHRRRHHHRTRSAAFRTLVAHLRARSDVQNIDIMNLAGFCRNCLSRWYREAAAERGLVMGDPEAREIIYACPTRNGRRKQKAATPEQLSAYAASGHSD